MMPTNECPAHLRASMRRLDINRQVRAEQDRLLADAKAALGARQLYDCGVECPVRFLWRDVRLLRREEARHC